MKTPLLIDDLWFRYPRARGNCQHVLAGLELSIARGEIVALIGPSGCGKSTFLRLLAGLLDPSSGRIELGGAKTALVFQQPTLMPWRSVLDNALFGLECGGPLTITMREQARRLLAQMGLEDHLRDRPDQLSEGMKQRVNLARALLTEPEVLLLDEPFAALDVMTRRHLQDELLARWGHGLLTIVLVSHSLEDVAYLADRVIVLTDKPTRVQKTVTISLARPRARGAKERLALFELVERLSMASSPG